MRGWVRWIVGLAILALLPILLRATLLRPKPVEVEVATLGPGLVEDTVTNSQAGTVKSRRRARVGAERAGRIAELHHREGNFVAPGELLIVLDQATVRAQLEAARRDAEAARASVSSLEAAARLARQEYDRLAKLVTDGVVSQSAHDEAKSGLDRADA